MNEKEINSPTRLKVSRETYLETTFDEAASIGESWAFDDAEYEQLKKLAEACRGQKIDRVSEVSVAQSLGLDCQGDQRFWDSIFGDEKPRALLENETAFQAGFIFGALKIWELIADQG